MPAEITRRTFVRTGTAAAVSPLVVSRARKPDRNRFVFQKLYGEEGPIALQLVASPGPE